MSGLAGYEASIVQCALETSPLHRPMLGGGYAYWVIISLYSLREYLDLRYRRLIDVLEEMTVIVQKLGLSAMNSRMSLPSVSVSRTSKWASGVGSCTSHRETPVGVRPSVSSDGTAAWGTVPRLAPSRERCSPFLDSGP